jgi:hypothetical protein
MSLYSKIKAKATLTNITRWYLWWVVIRWFLRWGATAIFLIWIWFLAPEYRRNAVMAKLHMKTYFPTIEWSTTSTVISLTNGVTSITYGLREDGVVCWKLNKESQFDYTDK